MLINNTLLDKVTAEAKESPRLRMNFNFHDAAESPAQRLLNALEMGTVLPKHRHRNTAETYILLRGKLKVMYCDEQGTITETFYLDPLEGNYGIHIPVGQWHTIEVLESGSVIFEVKDGPYAPFLSEDMIAE